MTKTLYHFEANRQTKNSIYMIFTILASTALAQGSIECNFSEPTQAQCFGAVGQPLIFHLPNTNIRLTKDKKSIILKTSKNHKVIMYGEFANRSELFTNGTFKLGNAKKRHSGNYVLEEYGHDGTLVKKVSVHVQIQAPVSKPTVFQKCFSREEMHISCSSEGDGVEFILTLHDVLLEQTRGYNQSRSHESMNETEDTSTVTNITISLHGELTGNLKCQVRNSVSTDETVIYLMGCKDLSSFPFVTMAVIASVVLLLLLGGLCIGTKRLHNRPRLTTFNEGNDDGEIVYANVDK